MRRFSPLFPLLFLGFTLLSMSIWPGFLFAKAGMADADYSAYYSSRYRSADWDNFVKEGMGAFHAGEYEIAQKNLYKAFNLGCESPLVLFQLALINEYQKSWYSSLEFYQMAKVNFKKANKNHRYNLTFNENYGRALYFSGKKDEAIPLLKAASKNTKSFWLLKMLGMMAYEEGDMPEATSYFERAVRIQDSDVTKDELVYMYTLLARLFLNKGERDGALRYYTQIVELDPNNAEARRFLDGIRRSYEQERSQDQMIKMFEGLKDM